MKNKISFDRMIHLNMSLIGGFLGAHAILLRGGNFGSAQTGNLVELMLDISELNWPDFGIRLIAAILFCMALVLSVLLAKAHIVPMKPVTLAVEALGMIATAMLPADMNAVVALYPVFFISAFQWGTFSGADGYSCATIFSTNNLRQSVTGWTEYFLAAEEKPMHKHKAIFFTQTVCCFMLGALVGGALSMRFGPKGMFFGLIPIGSALYLVSRQATQESQTAE